MKHEGPVRNSSRTFFMSKTPIFNEKGLKNQFFIKNQTKKTLFLIKITSTFAPLTNKLRCTKRPVCKNRKHCTNAAVKCDHY